MALWKRRIEHKDGTVREKWYGSVNIDSGERYENGKVKYTRRIASLGDVAEYSRKEANKLYQSFIAAIEREQEEAKAGKLVVKDRTLTEFVEDYLAHKRDAQKLRAWKRDEVSTNHYTRFIDDPKVKLSETGARTIDSFKAYRLQTVTKTTLKRDLEVLRRMYALAIKWGYYKGDNPVTSAGIEKVKLTDRRRPWTREEQEAVFSEAEPEHLRVWLMIRLSGMRPGEVTGLLKSRIRREIGLIRLLPEDTKTKEGRDIPITPYMTTIIDEALEGNESEHVFVSTAGEPYSSPLVPMRALNRIIRRKGMARGLTQHGLRHTYATELVGEVDPETLRSLLGHSDIRTTQIYIHTKEELKTRAAGIAEKQVLSLKTTPKTASVTKLHKAKTKKI